MKLMSKACVNFWRAVDNVVIPNRPDRCYFIADTDICVFSGAETALTAASEARMRQLVKRNGNRQAERVEALQTKENS